MSQRSRGQEAVIKITVIDEYAAAYGIFGPMEGSFTKVKDFTETARMDLVESEYLGEEADDLDQQMHGWDLAWTIDEKDAAAISFMDLIVFKEANNLPPPELSVQVTTKYRDNGVTRPRTRIYSDVVAKVSESGFGGRKEYISNSIEAKAKKRSTIVG